MKALFSVFLIVFFLPTGFAWADDTSSTPGSPEAMLCDIQQADVCYGKALDMHYGKDVPKDKDAAHKIFAQLCEADMSKACHAAVMSVSKFSANPDFDKSMYYQKKGCELGTPRSCFVVGRNYEGPWKKGLVSDHKKARKYFKRACKLGMELGCQYAKVKATGYRLNY
jgi:TPR repeat protein